VANTLAYYDTATITAVKSFIVQAPGVKWQTKPKYKLLFFKPLVGATTISITTLCGTTRSITPKNTALSINYSQLNNTQHLVSLTPSFSVIMLSVI